MKKLLREMKKLPRKLLHALRVRGLATVLLCFFLAALVGLNLLFTTLEQKYAWRTDFSFNAITSYGENTAEVLAGLENPVHIYALYSRGQQDQPLLELLNRYAASSPMVTWEQTDISLNPGLLTRFRTETGEDVANDSVIVSCEETGRWKVLSASDFITMSFDYTTGAYQYAGLAYESSLTSAIVYVTQGIAPRVMILQGHGEKSEEETELFAQLLDMNHYDVYYFTLNTTQTTLTPGTDLLVIMDPQKDLSDKEMEQVTEFVTAGGSIFFTCDWTHPVSQMPNLMALLRSYGFLPLDGMVMAASDEPNTYDQSNRSRLIPRMQSTSVTQEMISAGHSYLVTATSCAFELPEQSDRYLLTEAVLTTTQNAWLYESGRTSQQKQSQDRTGPFALALCASRVTDSGDMSNAFVLGSSKMLISNTEYASTFTEEFILRTVKYLLNQDSSAVDIGTRTAVRPALRTESTTMGSLIIAVLPLAVLGAAAFVLFWRRHK